MERLTEKVFGFVQLKACGNDFCKDTCAEHDEEKSCKNCHIQKAFEKLAEYENLEELIGIPLKDIAEIFSQNIQEDCKNPRKAIVLTDDDVDKWNCYKNAEEQGLLLRLPCKVGDIIYEIHPLTGKITQRKIKSIIVRNCPDLTIMYKSGYDYSIIQEDFGKTVFLTQAEAEQKLKEMEGD